MSAPRGRGGRKKYGHKGGSKHFTDVEELKRESEKIKKEKEMRRDSDEESGEEGAEEGGAKAAARSDGVKGVVDMDKKLGIKVPKGTKGSGSSASSEGEESEEEERPKKGPKPVIEIENPNRVQQKQKKITELSIDDKPQLSRREREAAEAARKKAEYERLHAEGKTDEARADLARLAIIRKQREEAAKKQAAEKEEREKKEKERQAKEAEQKKKQGGAAAEPAPKGKKTTA